jgi:hypothetical protein
MVISDQPPAAHRRRSSELRRFIRVVAQFSVGFIVMAATGEAALAFRTRHNHGEYLVGHEVYLARELAARGDDRVQTLIIGDSVARQLYPQGQLGEGRESLATNQAIAVEGQYYLLREALGTHRHVTDVVLLYAPPSWSNNLDQVFTADYFCGYFHEPGEIVDAFRETRSVPFLLAHIGRAVLPNLMATNSWMNLDETPLDPPVRPAAVRPLPLSKVSRDFLGEMHALCGRSGVRLHVDAPPSSDQFPYRDDSHVYDTAILYLPAAWFRDTIHLKPQYLARARTMLERHLSLPRAAVVE